MIDRSLKIKVILPFGLLIVSLIAFKLVNFKSGLTSSETKMFGFVTEKIELQEIVRTAAHSEMKSPIEIIIAKPKDFPATPLSAVVPQAPADDQKKIVKPDLKVSMIVMSDKRKIAVINGLILTEGDRLGNARIARIERNRVLVSEADADTKEQKSEWLHLEVK